MPEFKLPKVSEFLRPLIELESQIKTNLETATGLSLPPTPGEMIASLFESVEGTAESTFETLSVPFKSISEKIGEKTGEKTEFIKTSETTEKVGESSGKRKVSFKV